MAVLHHHRLVAGQSEGDAVLPPAVDGLQRQQGKLKRCTFWGKVLYFHNILKSISAAAPYEGRCDSKIRRWSGSNLTLVLFKWNSP